MVKAADKLDLLVQSREYEKGGARSLQEFWDTADSDFAGLGVDDLISDLIEELKEQEELGGVSGGVWILWNRQFRGFFATPFGVLAMMFLIAYIENIFPPSPKRRGAGFAGTLIGIGVIGFAPALIVATLGSVLGFMTAYVLGRYFEQHFVSGATIAICRSTPFIRSSACSPLRLRRDRREPFSCRHARVRFILRRNVQNESARHDPALGAERGGLEFLHLGMVFANNWRVGAEYLALYSKVATAVFGAAVVVFLWWFFGSAGRLRIEDRGSDRESKIEGQESPSMITRSSILCLQSSIFQILYLQSSSRHPRSMDILKRLRVARRLGSSTLFYPKAKTTGRSSPRRK